MGLMVIVEKIRGVGMVKSYGAGHNTALDTLLRFKEGIHAIHPADTLNLSIYDNTDAYGNQTLSDKNIPRVLEILSEYWKATGVEVTYSKLFTLMDVK